VSDHDHRECRPQRHRGTEGQSQQVPVLSLWLGGSVVIVSVVIVSVVIVSVVIVSVVIVSVVTTGIA
jgi:hypothetical protein